MRISFQYSLDLRDCRLYIARTRSPFSDEAPMTARRMGMDDEITKDRS